MWSGPGRRSRSRWALPRTPRMLCVATVSSGQPAASGGTRTLSQPGAWAVAPPDRGASHRGKRLSRADSSGLTSFEARYHIVCGEDDRFPCAAHRPGVQDSATPACPRVAGVRPAVECRKEPASSGRKKRASKVPSRTTVRFARRVRPCGHPRRVRPRRVPPRRVPPRRRVHPGGFRSIPADYSSFSNETPPWARPGGPVRVVRCAHVETHRPGATPRRERLARQRAANKPSPARRTLAA